jgi:hypothetical protein
MLASVTAATQHTLQILAQSAPQFNSAPRMNNNCYYCNRPPADHIAKNCPKTQEDMKAGLVIPDPQNLDRVVLPNGTYIPGKQYYLGVQSQQACMLKWHKQQSSRRNPPPHMTSNFLSFLDCNNSKAFSTSMAGYNLLTTPLSSACIIEIIDKDADKISQFLVQKISQLAHNDPVQTLYVNKLKSRCKDMAGGILKRTLSCTNKGNPNTNVQRCPACQQIVQESSDNE